MNTVNNKRRLRSQELIEKAFMELLQSRTIGQITVSDICKLTGLNRSTFYANYADIYALADKLRERLEGEVAGIFGGDMANGGTRGDHLPLLRHIYENQIFYNTYFKLGYDSENPVKLADMDPANMIFPAEHMEYHIEFFRAGFNAILKRWLQGGCRETPEELLVIIREEYRGRM